MDFQLFLIPVLYYLGNIKAVSFSFFIASLLAFYIFSGDELNQKNKNIRRINVSLI